MATPTEKRISQGDRLRRRAELRTLSPGIVGFFVTDITVLAFNPDGRASVWNLLWWLSPMVFVLWTALGMVKCYRRSDEYQRLVQLQSMAAGFAATMIVAIVSSQLDAARILSTSVRDNQAGWVIFAGTFAWVGTLWFKSARTR